MPRSVQKLLVGGVRNQQDLAAPKGEPTTPVSVSVYAFLSVSISLLLSLSLEVAGPSLFLVLVPACFFIPSASSTCPVPLTPVAVPRYYLTS